ncbi:MAG TPA: DoxX family protein [Ferruginibacter sp.]|nr:DoxX family protein [Ferruginibacter sp.]
MKKIKITYWITTAIIVLFDGVIPAFTFNTALAKQGVSHLLYPDYFRIAITMFKVAGAIILITPSLKGRIKEWAYAGFAFVFAFASISHFVVDGMNFQSFFPLIFLGLLALSYISFHKLNSFNQGNSFTSNNKIPNKIALSR